MSSLLAILVLSVVTVVGDFFIKTGADSGKPIFQSGWFWTGAIIYGSTAFGWFYVMKYVKLSSLGVLYSITTALLLVVLGILYYHERLNFYEIVGVSIAVISIFLLARFM